MGHFLGEALDGRGTVANRLVVKTELTYVYLLKVGDLYVEKIEKDSVRLTKQIERACKFNWVIESQEDKNAFCRYIVERTSILNDNYTIVEYVVETIVYETPVEIKTRYDGNMQLVSTEELRRQKVREEQQMMEVPLKEVDETMHGTTHRITDEIRERTDKNLWSIDGNVAEPKFVSPELNLNTEPPELDDWSKF